MRIQLAVAIIALGEERRYSIARRSRGASPRAASRMLEGRLSLRHQPSLSLSLSARRRKSL